MLWTNKWNLTVDGTWASVESGTVVNVSIVTTEVGVSYRIQVDVEARLAHHSPKTVTVEDYVGSLDDIMPKIDELVVLAQRTAQKKESLQRDLGAYLNEESNANKNFTR